MNARIRTLAAGSHTRRWLDDMPGEVLYIDSAQAAEQGRSSKVDVQRLDLRTPSRHPHIPDRLREHGSPDGASMVETVALDAWYASPELAIYIRSFVKDLDLLIVVFSLGGGTANGLFAEVVRLLRVYAGCRAVYIHALGNRVNEAKAYSRLYDLFELGRSNNEHHFLAFEDAEVRTLLSLSPDDYARLGAMTANLNALY